MAEYEMNDTQPVTYDPDETATATESGVGALEAAVTGKYPKAGFPWPALFSRSVPICPPPKLFWDLKYGLPKTVNLLIMLMIMIAIETTKPEITCRGSTSEIKQEEYNVGLLLTMSIVMFIYTLIILALMYFVGIAKLLVISLGGSGNSQAILNFWFLELSWHVVLGFLIFAGACDTAVHVKEKQDDIDKSTSDPNSGCSDSDYDVGGFVFAYSVAFIWVFTLNIWSIYVYYKACKSDYGLPCAGGGKSQASKHSYQDNVHAV
mmetsp:Transcript_47471/g.65897  ORF Transcript_47471/g.65897 Transcript_47471/m.65897 type:complete len:263 (+) Transcript_47471:84-872(+)